MERWVFCDSSLLRGVYRAETGNQWTSHVVGRVRVVVANWEAEVSGS
jgi:hypothetical protein